jgi:hypothetical protein
MSDEDRWFVAEGEDEGKPVLIRGRQDLHEVADPNHLNQLIRIQWTYEPENHLGLPAEKLNETMGNFEDKMIDALEHGGDCIFYCVYTHNGLKEWSAYTCDVETACDNLNAALAADEHYPIELIAEDDPEWHDYHGLLKSVGVE